MNGEFAEEEESDMWDFETDRNEVKVEFIKDVKEKLHPYIRSNIRGIVKGC